jgi:hypothetical protein
MKLFGFAIFISTVVLMTGCSTTVPVTVKFPSVPDILLEKCPQLKTIDSEKVSIIDYTKTVTINYTNYHDCAVKHDAWVLWYQTQKDIFEEVSK